MSLLIYNIHLKKKNLFINFQYNDLNVIIDNKKIIIYHPGACASETTYTIYCNEKSTVDMISNSSFE